MVQAVSQDDVDGPQENVAKTDDALEDFNDQYVLY